jgi:beta-xylosidase
MIKHFIAAIIFTIPFLCSSQQNNKFQPGKIWYDTDGNPVNAHAGGFLFHEGKYYWFGQIMIPGKRGSDAWVGVSCYSSTDLYNWENRGVALHVEDHSSHQITRGCKIERPKVIYNQKTKKFVMWWHHDINGQGHKNAMAGIAVSDKVDGPYQFVRVFRPLSGFLPFNISQELLRKDVPEMALTYPFTGGDLPEPADSLLLFKRDIHAGQMVRDMTLFVDEDGKAYHIYSSEENSTLHIAELSDDYLGYSGKFARFFEGRFMEAPTIFKKEDKYYIIASGCTGWLPNEARSTWAPNIWGPWEELGNPCLGVDSEITFNSQGTFILPVQGKKDAFVFVADRWNPSNPIDGRYVWLPIQFEGKKPILRWKDEWDLNVFD